MTAQSQGTRARPRDPTSTWPCAKTRFLIRSSPQAPGVGTRTCDFRGGGAMQPGTPPGLSLLQPTFLALAISPLVPQDTLPIVRPPLPASRLRPSGPSLPPRPSACAPTPGGGLHHPVALGRRWPAGRVLTRMPTRRDPSSSQGPADARTSAGHCEPSAAWPGPHARHARPFPGLTDSVQ